MEAEVADTFRSQPARFSRYRSVRKAAYEQEKVPPVPAARAARAARAAPNAQQSPAQINRAPSRYRRPTTSQNHDEPLPIKQLAVLPIRSQARPLTSRPQAVPEEPAVDESVPPLPRSIQDTNRSTRKAERPFDITYTNAPPAQASQRTTRYRSQTTSTPKARQSVARRSYDVAREEARLILEGEYDRLQRLKQQQEQAERERKRRAEASAAAAQRAEQEKEAPKSPHRSERSSTKEQSLQSKAQRARQLTIGGGSSHASPPVSTTQSPLTLQQVALAPALVPASKANLLARKHRSDESFYAAATISASSPKIHDSEPQERRRRATISKSKVAPQTIREQILGNGPPISAVNGPAHTLDAPVSAVNAGERRVEIRFAKSKITLPVTPSTTVKDLLNSASVIMSQPIDPRTSILVETYYPLGLERPLRRYEHIRDVMNSWDSDTQNYLMIMPESECATTGLDQNDAPEQAPGRTMLNLHHSQKPGKWEKHWMLLKDDGQVTASVKENDGNALNVFHLSDFDIYMPTRKQLKKLRPPKKICFAVKSQQRSIMFESTENFVHFFSTNDKAVADRWYHAVQAWRSWYLLTILEAGTTRKAPPATAIPAVATSTPTGHVARPPTSHARDSIPYQLGSFQPLLDILADSFTYGEPETPSQKSPEHKSAASPQRGKSLVDRARTKSNTEGKVTGLERHMSTKRQTPPTSFPRQGLVDESKSRHEDVQAGVGLASTDAGFTGKGLLARAFSVKRPQAEENAGFLDNTENAFTGTGLLSRKISTKKFVNENSVVPENTNDAFTGGGLMAVQRSLTKKRSQLPARPGQPLVTLAANSDFQNGSLLRSVEGYEIATGAHLPPIDRSRGQEVKEKTGEV